MHPVEDVPDGYCFISFFSKKLCSGINQLLFPDFRRLTVPLRAASLLLHHQTERHSVL